MSGGSHSLPRGCWDSLLETAREAPTILPKCAVSWAPWMWQKRHSLGVCIWFQDWAHLSPESPFPMLPHPHRSQNNYFSISVQFFFPRGPSFFWSARIAKWSGQVLVPSLPLASHFCLLTHFSHMPDDPHPPAHHHHHAKLVLHLPLPGVSTSGPPPTLHQQWEKYMMIVHTYINKKQGVPCNTGLAAVAHAKGNSTYTHTCMHAYKNIYTRRSVGFVDTKKKSLNPEHSTSYFTRLFLKNFWNGLKVYVLFLFMRPCVHWTFATRVHSLMIICDTQ